MGTSGFLELVRLVVDGDVDQVSRRRRAAPELARMALPDRKAKGETACFFTEICHYMYGGDTALHMAAAAFSVPMAKVLVAHGADCRAKNRRGAEPLHYAADANRSEPRAQAAVIEYLISVGADPNAVDGSGVSPLHRAVRTRSLAAVRALLDGGAKPRRANQSGSTALHLAVQNTGRGGSGSAEARREQEEIIKLLIERGGMLSDRDGRGKKVKEAAMSEWVRELLNDGEVG